VRSALRGIDGLSARLFLLAFAPLLWILFDILWKYDVSATYDYTEPWGLALASALPTWASLGDWTVPALLAALLASGLAQSDRSDGAQPDQSAPSADRAAPRLDPAAIRAAYARLGSKNKVWEWLRAQYGIRAKPDALRLINEALDDRDDEPPAAFGWLAENTQPPSERPKLPKMEGRGQAPEIAGEGRSGR
jgi:hypothetical protein